MLLAAIPSPKCFPAAARNLAVMAAMAISGCGRTDTAALTGTAALTDASRSGDTAGATERAGTHLSQATVESPVKSTVESLPQRPVPLLDVSDISERKANTPPAAGSSRAVSRRGLVDPSTFPQLWAEVTQRWPLLKRRERVEIANELAWLLASHPSSEMRDGAEGVRLAQLACHATELKSAWYLDTLAAAHAAKEDFANAILIGRQALATVTEDDPQEVRATIIRHLDKFVGGLPCLEQHEPDLLFSRLLGTDGTLSETRRRACLHWTLAHTFRKKGQIELMFAAYAQALAVDSSIREIHVEVALQLLRRGDLQGAERHFVAALRLDGNDPETLNNLGTVRERLGKFASAAELFQQAVDLRSDWVVPQNNLAWLLANAKDPSLRNPTQALALAENVCSATQHREPQYLDTLAAAQAAAGKFDDAVKTLDRAVPLVESSGDASKLLPQLQLHRTLYRHKVTLDSDRQAKIGLAMLRLQAGDLNAAAALLGLAADEAPDAETLNNLGTVLQRRGESAAAIHCFKTAVQLKKAFVPAANNLAWILATHPDEKLRSADQAVVLAEHCCNETGFREAVYLDTLAAAYAEAGRFDEALRVSEEAGALIVARNPAAQEVVDVRSGLYRAEVAYREDADWLLAWANGALRDNRLTMAAGFFTLALDLRGEDPDSWNSLGVVRQRQRKVDLAVKCFGRALELQPNMASAMNNLAWLLATQQHPEASGVQRAVALAEQICILAENRDPVYLDTLAAAYAADRRFEEAIAAIERGIDAAGAKQPTLVREMQARLTQYRQRRPHIAFFSDSKPDENRGTDDTH